MNFDHFQAFVYILSRNVPILQDLHEIFRSPGFDRFASSTWVDSGYWSLRWSSVVISCLGGHFQEQSKARQIVNTKSESKSALIHWFALFWLILIDTVFIVIDIDIDIDINFDTDMNCDIDIDLTLILILILIWFWYWSKLFENDVDSSLLVLIDMGIGIDWRRYWSWLILIDFGIGWYWLTFSILILRWIFDWCW